MVFCFGSLFTVMLYRYYKWVELFLYTLNITYNPGVGGVEIFLHSFVSRLALGSTQPPIKWVPGDFSSVKAAEHRTSHPTSSLCRGCVYVDPCIHIPHGSSWPVMGIQYLYLTCVLRDMFQGQCALIFNCISTAAVSRWMRCYRPYTLCWPDHEPLG